MHRWQTIAGGLGIDNTTTVTHDSLGRLVGDANSLVPHAVHHEYESDLDEWIHNLAGHGRLTIAPPLGRKKLRLSQNYKISPS